MNGKKLLNAAGLNLTYEEVLHLLISSPPCQLYSRARGFRDPYAHGINEHFFHTIRLIYQTLPLVFLIENVEAILDEVMRPAWEQIVQWFGGLPYQMEYWVMDSSHYNTPQSRRRIFIQGVHKSLAKSPVWPEPNYSEEGLRMIDVLPNIKYFVNRLRRDDPKFFSRYEVMRTVTASGNWDFYDLENGLPRNPTSKELLKLCGYPRDFSFPDSVPEGQRTKQLGNSIMPPLMQALCQTIRDQIL